MEGSERESEPLTAKNAPNPCSRRICEEMNVVTRDRGILKVGNTVPGREEGTPPDDVLPSFCREMDAMMEL